MNHETYMTHNNHKTIDNTNEKKINLVLDEVKSP